MLSSQHWTGDWGSLEPGNHVEVPAEARGALGLDRRQDDFAFCAGTVTRRRRPSTGTGNHPLVSVLAVWTGNLHRDVRKTR